MADEDRGTGRWPEDARFAHPPPDEGVHERRLAGFRSTRRRRPGAAPPAPSGGVPGSRRAAREVRRGWHARVAPRAGAAESVRRRHGRAVRRVCRAAEAVRPRSPHAKNAQFRGNSEAYRHVCAPRGRKGRKGQLGHGCSSGITSAQHPVRRRPKAMHDSYLPAIIRTASPNLHIEPRRRSDRVEEQGALSLVRPPGPRSSVDRAGAF